MNNRSLFICCPFILTPCFSQQLDCSFDILPQNIDGQQMMTPVANQHSHYLLAEQSRASLSANTYYCSLLFDSPNTAFTVFHSLTDFVSFCNQHHQLIIYSGHVPVWLGQSKIRLLWPMSIYQLFFIKFYVYAGTFCMHI